MKLSYIMSLYNSLYGINVKRTLEFGIWYQREENPEIWDIVSTWRDLGYGIKELWGTWIMRYLKRTLEFGIWYQREGKSELLGYTDSNYAGDVDDSRSTSGYVFLMSGGAVAWSSRKQPIVTLSITEA